MKHTILLTFDYELFLGKSGTIENCLLKPTNLLLEILKKNNAHGTFFIDITHLLKLVEVGNMRQYNLIKNQIQNMVRDGHEIGLHIHPHWVDAEYQKESETWLFKDFSKYKLGNCPDTILSELFDQGTNLLNVIAKEIIPEYKVKSFRAGGWCVDPFINLKEHFERNEIMVDASVIPQRKLSGNSISSFDYTDIVTSKPYRFGNSVHNEDENGGFVEIPMSTFTVSPLAQVLSLIKRRFSSKSSFHTRMGDGKSVFDIESSRDIKRYTKYFSWTRTYYSLDSCSESIVNRVENEKKGLLTIVSHPKCLSQRSLSVIDKITASESNSCITITELCNSL